MTNIFHIPISLPFTIDFRIAVSSPMKHNYLELPIANIPPKLVKWLDSKNLEVASGRYFYMPPNYQYKLHIDIPNESNYVRLNFVQGGDESEMIWYKSINSNCSGKQNINSLGTLVKHWDELECEEIYRVNIQGWALVNVGIIHTVKNKSQPRHCYAFFIKSKKLNKILEWNEIDYFF